VSGEQDRHARMRQEDGSALLLLPAGVLVVVVLGALALDAAAIFAAQRQLMDSAAGAANDAVTVALDPDRFYGCGELVLDPEHTSARVAASLSVRSDEVNAWDVRVSRTADGAPTVVVRLGDTVDRVFARSVPGIGSSVDITATAEAVAREGGATTAPTAAVPGEC
jgi:hypothetical protein